MAKVPADIDRADRIVAGLTARQLLILGGDAFLLWSMYLALGKHVPLPAFGVLAVVAGSVGATWAFASMDGMPLERLALAGVAHLRAGSRRVLAPEGMPSLGESVRGLRQPSALRLPFQGVDGSGVIEVAPAGATLVAQASSINLSLRSEVEQQAVVASFAKMLNGSDAPIQFVVRSSRIDLSAVVAATEQRSTSAVHPALRRAALAHAAFLRDLGARSDVHSRQVLIALHDATGTPQGRAQLARRATDAQILVRGMGVKLRALDETDVADLLGSSFNLDQPMSVTASEGIVRGRP